MSLEKDNKIIRGLAQQLKNAASEEKYAKKRIAWADHNGLDNKNGPLIWVCPDDDGGWLELVPPSCLETQDKDLRVLEMSLRKLLYQHNNFDDDFVQEPIVRFDMPGEYTGYHYGNAAQHSAWGIEIKPNVVSKNAYKLENALQEEDNLQKLLEHEVDFIPDATRLEQLRQKYETAVDGLLEVQFNVPYSVLVQGHLIELVHLWSLDGLMYALYDEPEKIHKIMEHMSKSKVLLLERLEKNDLLFNNHSNIYTGSGGLGYTHTPPGGENIKVNELWGFADSQEFSHVSPQMFKEFAFDYQLRGLSRFGLACYGCCEPLDNRLDVIMQGLPNLRRISVSPWSNVQLAAEGIGKKAIFSWKPNPALVCSGIADEMREMVKITAQASKNCVTEIILKDIRSCANTPQHLQEFISLARSAFS